MANIDISPADLPLEGGDQRTSAWWGMICLIATEGILFVYLIFTYAYLGAQNVGPWPPTGSPSLLLAGPDTIVLLVSSFVLGWGLRGFRRGHAPGTLQIALAITLVMGVVFVAVQGMEWRNKPFSLGTDAYSSAYFTLTGVHMAHVVVGLVILLALLVWSLMGRFESPSQHLALGGLYWHFVDAVWLVVFTTIYLVPRLS